MYCDIAYLTGAGVIDAQVLADLADDANQPGDITAAVTIGNINGAATAATELIDSYLRKAYDASLPLVTPPEILRDRKSVV